MNNLSQPVELSFDVDGLIFTAQAWGNPNGLPVLALHGWLDNSASFFALAPLLNDVYLVAIDLAGHGKTSHRLGSFPYNIWEDVAEIFAIADQLQWDRFALLGHSRGGIISAIAAGTFPERITHLALIEGLFPEPSRAEDAPLQLANSIKAIKVQTEKARTIYPSMDSAIKARENGMFPLSYAASKALTERGVVNCEAGLMWGTDQRLLVPSAVKLLPDQFFAFIGKILAPIELILASEGLPKLFPAFNETVSLFPQIKVHQLAGGHHLHMEQEVGAVAEILNAFLNVR